MTALRAAVVAVVVVVLGIAGVVVYATTSGDDKPCPKPVYASSSRVFLATSPTTDNGGADATIPSYFPDPAQMASFAAVATSRELLVEVIKQLDLQMTPTELAPKIKATVERGTVIVHLVVTDRDPAVAQKIGVAESQLFADFVGTLVTTPLKATIIDPASYQQDPINPCHH